MELQNNFKYDPDTGIITRLSRKNSNGSYDKDGYLIIKFKKRQIKAHRLAWYLHHKKWPEYNIDHINGIRTDNRIENLRDVPQEINVLNTRRKPNESTGVSGVYIDKTNGLKKKFATKITGKTFRFYTLEEALIFRKSL